MTQSEKLQYARDNYSIGDKISRKGFDCNNDTVIISESSYPKENTPYFYDKSDIFLGANQIYCGVNDVWAKVKTKSQISNPQYEIY